MKLIFSDIHADKKSAKFIQNIRRGFEEAYCCGDICGYGKDFKYCIDMIRDLNIKTVLGNHDQIIVNGKIDRNYPDCVMDRINWTKKHIKDPEIQFLKSLPREIRDGDLLITHTIDLDRYIRTEDECKPLLDSTDAKIIAIGHTHVQALFEIGDRIVVNPGSITKSRGKSRRGYAIIDRGDVVLRDIEEIP